MLVNHIGTIGNIGLHRFTMCSSMFPMFYVVPGVINNSLKGCISGI